jgi:single-strand DNA-binding protein
MNSVQIIGRVCRDIEVRYSQNGNDSTAIARFTVAVDRRFKKEGGDTADFISCVAFGKTAEFLEKYFKKGMRIALNGRIQTGSYTNKDGVKVYTTDVIAENVEFCESKKDGEEKRDDIPKFDDGFMNIPEDISAEIPFGN